MTGPTSGLESRSAPTRLSVVIPNYNYGQFLAAAVDSALRIDWPDVEVIVVDDGSTDGSRGVLAGFGDRITVLSQPNSGPRVACNRGFAASTGDVVIFLDSDDQAEPQIMHEVVSAWSPGVTKVQVAMLRVDAKGDLLRGTFPRWRRVPEPAQIRLWMFQTGAYPTPPGSGNAYSRWFLEQIFPLDDRCGDAADSGCLAAAPVLGDVVTLPKPLVRYRIHTLNRSKLDEPARFTRQIERAVQRQRFAMGLAGQPTDDASLGRVLRRGRHLLQMRVAERRLVGGPPPVPGDTRLRLVLDTLASLAAPGPESLVSRVTVAAWCLWTLLMPCPVALRLIRLRFNPRRRRRWFARA